MVFTAYCGNLYGKYNYINFKTNTNSQTKFDYSLITSVIQTLDTQQSKCKCLCEITINQYTAISSRKTFGLKKYRTKISLKFYQ